MQLLPRGSRVRQNIHDYEKLFMLHCQINLILREIFITEDAEENQDFNNILNDDKINLLLSPSTPTKLCYKAVIRTDDSGILII